MVTYTDPTVVNPVVLLDIVVEAASLTTLDTELAKTKAVVYVVTLLVEVKQE